MRKRIYIAGPMTLGDRIDNLAKALKVYRELCLCGYAPMCPQLSFFAEPFVKMEHGDWLDIDIPWLQTADALLRLSGQSKGADREELFARECGIPIFYSIDGLRDFFEEKRDAG